MSQCIILNGYCQKTQWMIFNGQTVGGLTVYCEDTCRCIQHVTGWGTCTCVQCRNHLKTQWMILNGQTVGGLTVDCVHVDTSRCIHHTIHFGRHTCTVALIGKFDEIERSDSWKVLKNATQQLINKVKLYVYPNLFVIYL